MAGKKDNPILLGSDGKAVSAQPVPRISVLIDATNEGGAYLARSIMALMTRTNTKRLTTEFIIMVEQHDDWNKETVDFFQAYMKTIEFLIGFAPVVDFIAIAPQKLQESEPGYVINQLAKLSRGHWIVPLRASQTMRTKEWDERLIELVESRDVNPASIATIRFDVHGVPENATGVAFAISRGWYDSLGHITKHDVTEDYIAMIVDKIGDPNRSLFLDDIDMIDPEWGSIVRSMPDTVHTNLMDDRETLTKRIKEGF